MKKILLAFVATFISPYSYSQTRADYDMVVKKFQSYYNHQQNDSIYNMLTDAGKAKLTLEKTEQTFKQVFGSLGEMKAYEFTKEKEKTALYKVTFDKSVLTLVLAISTEQKLEAFRFIAYQPENKVPSLDEYILSTKTGEIHGTLSLPDVEGPVPVVLIIAGSGPTDRDGNNPMAGKNNSYHMLADSLKKSGIASVRYDKRGIGGSTAAISTDNKQYFSDYINDAAGFIKQLNSDKRFSQVYVLGHSEGSLFAILAANKELVSGLISIAGAADPIDLLIEKQLSVQSKSIAEKARVIIDSLKKGYMVTNIPEGLTDVFNSAMQPYMQTWLKYTPTEELAKLHEPILIVQGTTDLQVGTDQAKKLNSANDRAQLLIINGMNHVLKNAPEDRAGNLATYSNPDLALCPGLVSGIVHFITAPPLPIRRKH